MYVEYAKVHKHNSFFLKKTSVFIALSYSNSVYVRNYMFVFATMMYLRKDCINRLTDASKVRDSCFLRKSDLH